MNPDQRMNTQDRFRVRREIVGRHLNIDRWVNSKLGDFTCPAGHSHAWAMIDGAINLYCPGGKERRCFEELQELLVGIREDVRQAEGGQGFIRWEPTEEDRREHQRKVHYYRQVAHFAHAAKPVALSKRKTVEDLIAASPVRITQPLCSHWRLVLEHLFTLDDVIWIGEPHETSKPEYACNFKTVGNWLSRPVDCPANGPQWSPACWNALTFSRTQTEVRHQWFWPVEGDAPLSLEDQATLLLWLAQAYPLMSVTFSGRVSLHALFLRPRRTSPESWDRFRAALEAFEFDLGNFRIGGTTRCPGWLRQPDKPDMERAVWQELLYLNPAPWQQLQTLLS
jgi:hypothetical protein